MFLVKEGCEYVPSDLSWGIDKNYVKPAPKGYKWVTGARKKDIEWKLMNSIAIGDAKKAYKEYRKIYETQNTKSLFMPSAITETGLESWGDILYMKGESFTQYLKRNGMDRNRKYLIDTYSFINDGEWISQGSMGWFSISQNDKPQSDWEK